MELQVIASGAHLSKEHGLTVREIRDDGFEPDEMVEITPPDDSPSAICKSMGLGLTGYGLAIERLRPDIVVLLGDRFETLCMAAAAQVFRVPVAHIHGGESSEGAIDEAFRHSITKMSHLHFTSCEVYRQRVIQLGESPDRVFNVGAPGVENVLLTETLSRDDVSRYTGLSPDQPYFIVTFHPVTLEKSSSGQQFKALLDAMDAFPNHNLIFTKANADTEGRVINRLIDEYAENHPRRCLAVTSLGALRYLSALKYCSAAIGNSSSGIIEAPSMRVPTVNIGDRQRGRVQARSILNCPPESDSIRESIARAISPLFVDAIKDVENPYEKPGTSRAIVETISRAELSAIIKKTFYDMKSGFDRL